MFEPRWEIVRRHGGEYRGRRSGKRSVGFDRKVGSVGFASAKAISVGAGATAWDNVTYWMD